MFNRMGNLTINRKQLILEEKSIFNKKVIGLSYIENLLYSLLCSLYQEKKIASVHYIESGILSKENVIKMFTTSSTHYIERRLYHPFHTKCIDALLTLTY